MNSNKIVEEEIDDILIYLDYGVISKEHAKRGVLSLLSLQKIRTLEEVEEIVKERIDMFKKIIGLGQRESAYDATKKAEELSELLAKLTSLKQDSGEIKK
jgi:hypothetical protein